MELRRGLATLGLELLNSEFGQLMLDLNDDLTDPKGPFKFTDESLKLGIPIHAFVDVLHKELGLDPESREKD